MRLSGERLYLRFFEKNDVSLLVNYRKANFEILQMFTPSNLTNYDNEEVVIKDIDKMIDQRQKDLDYTFGIFLKENDELIGDISLFKVVRGPLNKCMLGYAIDKEHYGKGYATEAVKICVNYAFKELKLHRIEAGAMPRNIGSNQVLIKSGFHKEGLERKGLLINGEWEDHNIYSLLETDIH